MYPPIASAGFNVERADTTTTPAADSAVREAKTVVDRHVPSRFTPFRITCSQPWPGMTLCSVAGEVDACTAEQLKTHLLEALGPVDRVVVVDLSGLDFLGTAGLKVLLQAQYGTQHTQYPRRLRVVTGAGCVHRLLEVCGHSASFDTYSSVDAALAG